MHHIQYKYIEMATNYRGDSDFNIINKTTFGTTRDTKIRDIRQLLLSIPFSQDSSTADSLTTIISQANRLEYRNVLMLVVALLMYTDTVEENIPIDEDIIDEYFDRYNQVIKIDNQISDIAHKETMYRYYKYVLLQTSLQSNINPIGNLDEVEDDTL